MLKYFDFLMWIHEDDAGPINELPVSPYNFMFTTLVLVLFIKSQCKQEPELKCSNKLNHFPLRLDKINWCESTVIC